MFQLFSIPRWDAKIKCMFELICLFTKDYRRKRIIQIQKKYRYKGIETQMKKLHKKK